MPASRRSASSSRAPGRKGTPVSASCRMTSSVRRSMMSWTPIRTPASWKMRAESSSPSPTRPSACSCDHVPPKLSTSGVSAAIQYGSVSTRVPSMSQRTAASGGGFTDSCYPAAHRGARGRPSTGARRGAHRPHFAARAYPGGSPQGGRRRSRGRTGTPSARRRIRRVERRGRSRVLRDRASAGQREVRDGLLGRPRAVLRLPVHAPAGRHRRRGQAHAPLAGGDAAQARASDAAARSCGCSPASSPPARGRPSRRSSSTSRCARTSPASSRSAR